MDKGCIVRNIVKEIVKECKEALSDSSVHENFVSYYVNLLILDPNWGIAADHMSSRNDVSKFIRYVVDRLCDQNSPSLITLKMQFYFSCNFDGREELVKQNRKNLLTRISPIKHEILHTLHTRKGDDVQNLYKKIVYYVTLASGLGNPTITSVFKEAKAALTSVLFENELRDFCQTNPKEKEDLLHDYTQLVTGIRLFNKDSGKGGFGIGELPNLVIITIDNLHTELSRVLAAIMSLVNKLTTAIDTSYKASERQGRYKTKLYLPENVTVEDVSHVKDILLLYRQYELYTRQILKELMQVENHNKKTIEHFKCTMEKLHDIIQFRIAIPCNQVFPVFRELHDIWCEIQDGAILVAKLDQIQVSLARYVKNVNLNEHLLDALMGDSPTLTDKQRLKVTSSSEKIPEGLSTQNIIIRPPDFYKDVDTLSFQFLGFCGHRLVETHGGLIPGNCNLAIIRFEGSNYVFSSRHAAETFIENPEKYVSLALDLARNKPELINFLLLSDQLNAIAGHRTLIEQDVEDVFSREMETQTEDQYEYIVEENIDLSHKWNLWDLKREALKLADLTKMATVACQTRISNNVFNIGLQTFEYRDVKMQTKQDNYSNVPKPSNYLFGLRGRTDDKQVTVDLADPVDK